MSTREPRWLIRGYDNYGCSFCEETAEYEREEVEISGQKNKSRHVEIDVVGFPHHELCPTRTSFATWLERFLDEKGVNEERVFDVEANGMPHSIPVGSVIERMYIAKKEERAQIKDIIVKIDFYNGDVYHFFNHLAEGMAQEYAGVLT